MCVCACVGVGVGDMAGPRADREVWSERVGIGAEKMLKTEGLNRQRRGAG